MIARIALFALIATASPAMAAGIDTTHEEVKTAPGKLHARAYRPLAPTTCATPRTGHPAGGRILSGPPIPFHDAACGRQLASAAKAKRG